MPERLDVLDLRDDYATEALYVRGHVNLRAARAAMEHQFPDVKADMGAVTHDHWQWLPGYEESMYAVYGQTPGRGAFPVTACSLL